LLPEELEGRGKIYKYLAFTTKFCAGLSVVILSLFSCAPTQDQAPVIREMLYPSEVPAFFDTILICRVADPGNNDLVFTWSSESGTIRGEGDTITWNTPPEYGTYEIDVKAINASGQESLRQAGIDVVPFYRKQVDPDPEINLKLPIIGSGMVGEQSLVGPLTNAEISCDVPLANVTDYKYEWSCNGGRIWGAGLKNGTASRIGWFAPGVPGNYTVTVKVINGWSDIKVGTVYFKVQNPACCGQQDSGELYRWKE